MPLPRLLPGERLLLQLCRRDGWEPGRTEGSADPPTSRLPDLTDTDREEPSALLDHLTALSVQHAVQGLVFSNLSSSGQASRLFPDQAKRIRSTLALLTRQAFLWDFEQDRVLRHLAETGFRPVVLKGGALRRWVFSDPVERAMGDLDLLVDPGEVTPVLEALESLGYESEYPDSARRAFKAHLYHDRVTHPNGFHVEVHWGLTRPGAPVQLDPDLFVHRSHTIDTPKHPPLRVPSSEDMVLHTVSQSEQDGIRKLRRMVDLDRILASEEVEWGYIVKEAQDRGLYPSLCVTHRLASVLLGTPVPPPLSEGRHLPLSSRLGVAIMKPTQRLLRERERARVPDYYLFRLWCLPRWAQRGRWLREVTSGARDPLGWIWREEEEEEAGDVSVNLKRGLRMFIKLLAHQATVIASAVASSVRPGGRAEVRFWARHSP